MRGFVTRMHIEEAQARLRAVVPAPAVESIRFDLALGRALAEDIASPIDVPSFEKSAVDGYGVRAQMRSKVKKFNVFTSPRKRRCRLPGRDAGCR